MTTALEIGRPFQAADSSEGRADWIVFSQSGNRLLSNIDSISFLYQGTGGKATLMLLSLVSGSLASGSNTQVCLSSQSTKVESEDEPTNLELAIENIASIFALNQSEAARAFSVTRMTVRNWLKENRLPRKQTLDRIFDLSVIAQDWVHAGLKVDCVSLHKKIVDGKSLYELLCHEALDKKLIMFAGTRLKMQAPRKKIDRRSSK
ncbi:hypothetical protein [Endozoicomonas acroporae]|uniref:hypothetical protein n=1 Tax=Endozoicomonas acroporae TaxID=1701104 RepID=UPI0013D85ED9|nr:hypothetical protein [Endozoicomonas acroporae]